MDNFEIVILCIVLFVIIYIIERENLCIIIL